MSRCAALAAAMKSDITIYLDPTGEHGAFPTRLDVHRESEPYGCALMLEALGAGRHEGVLFDGPRFDSEMVGGMAKRVFTAQFVDHGLSGRATLTIRPGLADAASTQDGAHLFGPQYAPLDLVFEDGRERASQRVHPKKVRRFLVSMGGHDSRNLSGICIGALAKHGYMTTVVMSSSAPHLAAVTALAYKVGAALRVSPSPKEMIELLLRHDAAIGMAGVSMLERMACGLPSILVGIANNQLSNLKAAADLGVALVVSPGTVPSAADIGAAADALSNDRQQRETIAAKGLALVDAKGAHRLAEALEQALAVYRR